MTNQPANLFDSRYDYAWSTNGKVTSGKGESVEIKFSQTQNLTGMIVWNGYQRSEEHFKTNGRVAKMSISSGEISSNRFCGKPTFRPSVCGHRLLEMTKRSFSYSGGIQLRVDSKPSHSVYECSSADTQSDCSAIRTAYAALARAKRLYDFLALLPFVLLSAGVDIRS